jgi:hypothetical protein
MPDVQFNMNRHKDLPTREGITHGAIFRSY